MVVQPKTKNMPSMHIVYDMRHVHHHRHDFQHKYNGLCNYTLEMKTWHVLIGYLESHVGHHPDQLPIVSPLSLSASDL